MQETLTTTGNAHDEENNYDVRCNIYDISGNVNEWSTETSTNSNSPCTDRGGAYNALSQSTAYRDTDITSGSYATLGFRSIMYVK